MMWRNLAATRDTTAERSCRYERDASESLIHIIYYTFVVVHHRDRVRARPCMYSCTGEISTSVLGQEGHTRANRTRHTHTAVGRSSELMKHTTTKSARRGAAQTKHAVNTPRPPKAPPDPDRYDARTNDAHTTRQTELTLTQHTSRSGSPHSGGGLEQQSSPRARAAFFRGRRGEFHVEVVSFSRKAVFSGIPLVYRCILRVSSPHPEYKRVSRIGMDTTRIRICEYSWALLGISQH